MLADAIRKLSKERGISLGKVEVECNLSAGAICKWNDSSPRLINAKAVAEFFGISVDELIRLSGEENNEPEA